MLPPAALDVADRLIATLMTLARAAFQIASAGSTPTLPADAAETLFLRLVNLVTTLIRISNVGFITPAGPTDPARIRPAPPTPRGRTAPIQSLPRRPGWLLAALPDIAPAIAADLGALLTDPALAALLAAAPTLHRTLRPLLRGLGLTAIQPPPFPPTPPLSPSLPEPHHSLTAPPAHGDPPTAPGCRAVIDPPTPRLLTSNSLRYSNNLR